MNKLRHLFVIDPLESLNMELDSSLRLVVSLLESGDEVFFATVDQLSWQSGGNGPHAHAQKFKSKNGLTGLTSESASIHSLNSFHAIHMRKDPPYDLDYIAILWQLDAVTNEVRVYNQPHGLLRINEKLGILRYPQFIAPALVSSNVAEIFNFIEEECNGDAVIKPLTLYGGKGIERIQIKTKQRHEIETDLLRLTQSNKARKLVQPFDHAIFSGEVRAFLFGDNDLAWCLKMPASDQFLANSNFGSTRHAYTPSKKEVEMVKTVAQDLRDHFGIFMIGFDLIGGKISEINVTSPRLLHPDHDKTPYYKSLAALIQQDLLSFHRLT